MKGRQPERYSDSVLSEVIEFDRSMLEFHLDTLSSRSQEIQFEHFSRELLKRAICPNLLPHTGPTGGGDSKVDSETYPVADALALTWYSGLRNESATERWAFAFSIQRTWQSKLKDDISSLASTARGYTKAFYVTSQSVRDKTRAKLEDELRNTYKLDVRVLDRSWILDTIFDLSLQHIAVEELGVSSSIVPRVTKGPCDLHKESSLEILEERIKADAVERRTSFATVDACIECAILSRELEHGRQDTIGRFERADEMAMNCGSINQQVRIAYQRAWTEMFWFERFDEFSKYYLLVEARSKDSTCLYHTELLCNLWCLLYWIPSVTINVSKHTKELKRRLTSFTHIEDRPSGALHAESLLLIVRLILELPSEEKAARILRSISSVVKRSETLLGFPLQKLADSIQGIGEFLHHLPEYERLHEVLVDTISKRKGDIAGAELLLALCENQLDADQPIDAIRSAGKAFVRLSKHESRHTLCRGLYNCACAYERIGLLWAARGTLLAAASFFLALPVLRVSSTKRWPAAEKGVGIRIGRWHGVWRGWVRGRDATL